MGVTQVEAGLTSKRIVVKVGSSSLTDSQGRLDPGKMDHLVHQLAKLRNQAHWQVILVSSGAVAAGVGRLGWDRKQINLPEKQAAAAVGQGLLIDVYGRLFQQHQIAIGQVLLTKSDVQDDSRLSHICDTMETLLYHGIVPIVNENDTVAVDEIRVGDNDTLASLVAVIAGADMLVLLTDVDGMYTADPRKDPSARRIDDVFEITAEMESAAGSSGSDVGTGGMLTKLTAARTAVQAGITVILANSQQSDVFERLVQGLPVGTKFHATLENESMVGK